jgi:alkylglycerol monooxygenase
MNERLLALAIPLFLFFILLEYAVSRKQNKQTHQYAESIANLNVGIAERVTDMLTTGSFYFLFDYLHRHYAIWHIEANAFTWILLFLATDFVWYWYHRAGHRINIFWSVHVVHHQSEDFNYTVATRITVLQAVARALFWSGYEPVVLFCATTFFPAVTGCANQCHWVCQTTLGAVLSSLLPSAN